MDETSIPLDVIYNEILSHDTIWHIWKRRNLNRWFRQRFAQIEATIDAADLSDIAIEHDDLGLFKYSLRDDLYEPEFQEDLWYTIPDALKEGAKTIALFLIHLFGEQDHDYYLQVDEFFKYPLAMDPDVNRALVNLQQKN